MDPALIQGTIAGFRLVTPEVVLSAGGFVLLLLGCASCPTDTKECPQKRSLAAAIALIAVLVATFYWVRMRHVELPPELLASAMFRHDGLTWFAKGLGLVAGIVLVLMSWNQVSSLRAPEYYSCLLFILAGVGLVAASNDLIAIFLALELISIPTYILLYLQRTDLPTKEAVTKYFLLSIFSSALLLYGMSFLYGVGGSTNLEAIRLRLHHEAPIGYLFIALIMMTAALGFRITAVPFHFYAPDVFTGVPLTAAAMLAYLPKIAGFVALHRLITQTMLEGTRLHAWTVQPETVPMLALFAILTMFVGNILALLQSNLKRLFAYSSIAHAGYMLVALAVGNPSSPIVGIEAILFYLVAYGAMTVGFFAALVYLSTPDRPIEKIEDLAGLSETHPFTAFTMAVLLFSLMGLPPTAGFWGKLFIVLAAWSAGSGLLKALAILLAINAAIAGWYYLRVIGVIYLSKSSRPIAPSQELPALAGMIICVLLTIGLFIRPAGMWKAVEQASRPVVAAKVETAIAQPTPAALPASGVAGK